MLVISNNIDDRLKRRNEGRSKATQSGVPWILVHTETFATKSAAYRTEFHIKGWKSCFDD